MRIEMLLRKPSPETVQRFLAKQQQRELTYDAVGATAASPPAGFLVDHTRVQLGRGSEAFQIASQSLRNWRQFSIGWLEVVPREGVLEPGAVLAVVAHAAGVWWLNACRIVYVTQSADADSLKFGYAYGTLPGHSGCGEERFLVEMDGQERVWYDILAFSRPHRASAWLAYPYLRRVQRLFGRQSAQRMKQLVGRQGPEAVSSV